MVTPDDILIRVTQAITRHCHRATSLYYARARGEQAGHCIVRLLRVIQEYTVMTGLSRRDGKCRSEDDVIRYHVTREQQREWSAAAAPNGNIWRIRDAIR